MAISTGAAPHTAFINGIAIEHGSVTQNCNKKSSSFSVSVPKNSPGALSLVGGGAASIFVTCVAGAGELISGMLDTVDIDYIGTNIRVTGRDLSGQLHQMKIQKKFQNQTGSQIVEQVVGQAGLGANAMAASGLMAGKKVMQDWVKLADNIPISFLINELAEFDGAKWGVINGMFNYAALGTIQGVYTINYDPGPYIKSNATRLNVRHNVQVGGNVNVKSWNSRDKQSYTGTSNVTGKGKGNSTYNLPALDMAHTQQHAKARAAEMGRHAINVTATVVGDPSINAGMGLQLIGTGVDDNVYEIDNIVHDFGMSGYTMTITAKSMGSGGGGGGGGGQ